MKYYLRLTGDMDAHAEELPFTKELSKNTVMQWANRQ